MCTSILPNIDFAQVFISFLVLLFSLTVHEAAHAWSADRLGDATARLRGRVTLKRVYVLIDARHGIKKIDEEVLDLLDNAAVSYQVVLTKADKIKLLGAGAVPETMLDLAVKAGDASRAKQKDDAFVEAIGLYSLRRDDLLQGVFQISRFTPEATVDKSSFRRRVVEQIGSTVPLKFTLAHPVGAPVQRHPQRERRRGAPEHTDHAREEHVLQRRRESVRSRQRRLRWRFWLRRVLCAKPFRNRFRERRKNTRNSDSEKANRPPR